MGCNRPNTAAKTLQKRERINQSKLYRRQKKGMIWCAKTPKKKILRKWRWEGVRAMAKAIENKAM